MKKYNHILLLPHFFPISNLTLHLLQFIQDQETWEEKRWSVKFGRIEKSFLNHREENIKFQKLIISISSSEKFILNYLKNVGMVVIKIKLGHKELFYFTWEEGCGNWIVKLSCLLKSIRTFFFLFFPEVRAFKSESRYWIFFSLISQYVRFQLEKLVYKYFIETRK